MPKTKTELRKLSSPACHPRYTVTIPAGTRCEKVADSWVVADISQVIGGNAHDLAHYYIWLNDNEVED
jgi:hypothetical protein